MSRNAARDGYRKINQEMMLRATTLSRGNSEAVDAYLKRVTHLHLQGKRLRVIENLEKCSNLKVLYLYDNQIEVIENLDFSKLLSYVYLQNNLISVLPTLDLTCLRKLYLDDNQIQYVTGLEACTALEELHLANQRLPAFTPLEFDPLTLQAVAETLQVLEISGCQIKSFKPIAHLTSLRKLFAENNDIVDIVNIEMMVALPELEEAKFIGNPICQERKYRDAAIGASSDALLVLDDLPILKHQQIAMRGLKKHRAKIGAQMRVKRQEEKEAKGIMNSDELGESVADLDFFGDSIGDSYVHHQGGLGEVSLEGTENSSQHPHHLNVDEKEDLALLKDIEAPMVELDISHAEVKEEASAEESVAEKKAHHHLGEAEETKELKDAEFEDMGSIRSGLMEESNVEAQAKD